MNSSCQCTILKVLDVSFKGLISMMPTYIDPSLLGLLIVVAWVTQAVVGGQRAAVEQERYWERRREQIMKAEAEGRVNLGFTSIASLSDSRDDSAMSAWEMMDEKP